MALCVLEIQGLVRLALIDELGGQQSPGLHQLAIQVVRVVDHGEVVAAAQIFVEVDVTGEGFRHFRGDAIGHVGGIGRAEQGAIDFTGSHDLPGFQHHGLFSGLEYAAGTGDRDQFLVGNQVTQQQQLAAGSDSRQHATSGYQAAQGFASPRGAQHSAGFLAVDAESGEQTGQGVAAADAFFTPEIEAAAVGGLGLGQIDALHHGM